MRNIYTRKEAAKFLRISIETLDRCRRRGILPFRKIGDRIVFTENDLETLLTACANSGKATGGEK